MDMDYQHQWFARHGFFGEPFTGYRMNIVDLTDEWLERFIAALRDREDHAKIWPTLAKLFISVFVAPPKQRVCTINTGSVYYYIIFQNYLISADYRRDLLARPTILLNIFTLSVGNGTNDKGRPYVNL